MMNAIDKMLQAAEKDAFYANGAPAESRYVLADILDRTEVETIIVSRHAGAVEWLARQGITGAVIEQVTADDVRGKVVIGNLPLHLAAEAHQVGSIDLPGLTREQRGRDLTPEEMDAAGASIRWYVVCAVE